MSSARSGLSRADELRDRRAVPPRDVVERAPVFHVGALGDPRRFDQLIGDALKRRDDGDDRLAPMRVENDVADLSYRRRSRQRGPAELLNLHRD